MKILIVDDSKIIHKIVGSILEMLGYEPDCALNGADALEVLHKNPDDFSLVLLDWNMPVMDGIDCLRAIKADPVLSGIPVMMLTTESEAGRMALALREGAANYCTKPFTPEGLATKILECLGLGG